MARFHPRIFEQFLQGLTYRGLTDCNYCSYNFNQINNVVLRKNFKKLAGLAVNDITAETWIQIWSKFYTFVPFLSFLKIFCFLPFTERLLI